MLKTVFQDQKWKDLKGKLDKANYERIEKEADRIKNRPTETAEEFNLEHLGLSAAEMEIVNSITRNGGEISKDLANIKQSQAWFLNDVPIEMLNWIKLGQFYDRATTDLGSFNKAAGELLKVISNPFGQPPEEVIKAFHEAMQATAMVLGLESTQGNFDPMIGAYLSMISEHPRFRQLFVEMAMHTFKKPTSRAQEIIGIEGPAADEDTMQALLDKSLPAGITRRTAKDKHGITVEGTYDDYRKEFKTMWYNIGWGKIRDFGPVGIIAFLIQFFQGISKEKLS